MTLLDAYGNEWQGEREPAVVVQRMRRLLGFTANGEVAIDAEGNSHCVGSTLIDGSGVWEGSWAKKR